MTANFVETGAPKPASRCEERDGFEQIGLARAIDAGERHETRANFKPKALVVAEVRERKARQGHKAVYTRIGIST